MNSISDIKTAISDSIAVKQKLLDQEFLNQISAIANLVISSLRQGNKLILCGNGGSAADAQHVAAELINRYKIDRAPLPAIALTTDTSVLTSIANDYGYNAVFRKQIQALGKEGDILIVISTSGNSKNVLEAVDVAKKMGIKTVGLTGSNTSALSNSADISIRIPSTEVSRIQESHIMILHIICDIVEKDFARDLHATS